MNNLSSANKILLAVVILLVIVVGGLLFSKTSPTNDNYYAVMTSTGDLFFGKLHTFPAEYLTNVWTIQANPNDKENPLSLVRFDKSIFGPEDKVYINKKNTIWKAKLRADSQVFQQIKNSMVSMQSQVQGGAGVMPTAPNSVGGVPKSY